jgi:peptide/nickel transport system substrate-binding protein
MENRFGVKDFFVFLLLIVLIGIVSLAIVQYDRQWEMIQQINRRINEQTGDLARINRLLAQGVPTIGTPGTQPSAANNPMAGFERILKTQSAPDYAQGGQLVLLSQATTPKITPLIATDAFAFDLWAGYLFDTLCGRDPDTLEWTPNLANAWKISADSLTINFTLRKGVTFSDGTPLTADDVVFTFDLMRNPDLEDPIMKVGAERLDHVEKVDDYAVKFVFKEPYYKSFELASSTPILSKAFYSKYSIKEFNESTGLVMGSGPYRMPDPTSWRPQPGQPMVVVRNERYWGPAPSFDRVVWNVIEQPSARVTAFRNGDIDFVGQDNPPTPEQFTQLSADPQILAQTKHWALTNPTEAFYFIAWNEKEGRGGKKTAFADARVRKAMTLMTDRQAILQAIIHGYGKETTSPFAPDTPQCDPNIKPWPYDPVAAEKLLAEAGFHRQGDQMVGPDGKPLAFKILFNTNSEPRRRIASFLHDAYAKVGIDAQPENAEWSVFQQRLDNRQYEVAIAALGGALEGDPYEEFDTSQIAKTGQNIVQFSDPKMDAAIAKARSTVVDDKRMPLWHDVHRMIHEEEPYTYLFIYKELDFARDRIRGIAPTKFVGLNQSLEWYIPAAMQKSQ